MHDELIQTAARLIAEQGMDYASASHQAAQQLGLRRAAPLNRQQLEQAVREHLRLFCADTHPQELHALRRQALLWMERLDGSVAFSPAHPPIAPDTLHPHLCGAVWRGTATRLNDIYIATFCDDPKATEITLINWGIRCETGETDGMLRHRHNRHSSNRRLPMLAFSDHNPILDEPIGILLTVYAYNDLRGMLRPDRTGMARCGSTRAVRALPCPTASPDS